MALQPTARVDVINAHKRVNKWTRKQRSSPPGPCPACRSKEHWRSECPHKTTTCSVCHRMGHLAKVCRDKNINGDSGSIPRKQSQSNTTPRSHKTHLIERTDQEEPDVDE